jgi:decaprenylphospho-beta-D-ribofuranose 2-oxidase
MLNKLSRFFVTIFSLFLRKIRVLLLASLVLLPALFCFELIWDKNLGLAYSNLFELNQVTPLCPNNVDELVEIVRQAAVKGQQITVVGANQSQGGQALPSKVNGLLISLANLNQLVALNVADKLVTVQAGMSWADLQAIICPYKLAVRSMQSYADFVIGSSLSVNVHGQDLLNNPLIKTVRSFKLLDCDGKILNVSRDQNSELFGLVIGGYGLFGIIIEVTLELTDNVLLERQVTILDACDLVGYFEKNIKNNPKIEFYSARFDLNKKNYLQQAIVVSYRKISDAKILSKYDLTNISTDKWQTMLVNQAGKYGLLAVGSFNFLKNWRFWLEQQYFKSGIKVSRNQLMSFPLASLPQANSRVMYGLQEYFIPYGEVNNFLKILKQVTQKLNINLINVSVRHVNADGESYLSYSPAESCAFVLYFKIKKNKKNYQKVAKYASSLIDAAVQLGGKYYLPYQLLASKDQLFAAYPQFQKFIALKQGYDYRNIFSNQFYAKYSC